VVPVAARSTTAVLGWGRMAFDGTLNEGDGVRERVAYMFMIGMLILLVAVVFAVLGKGEYQPPPPPEQGLVVSHLV
jgi:hypothetical protein